MAQVSALLSVSLPSGVSFQIHDASIAIAWLRMSQASVCRSVPILLNELIPESPSASHSVASGYYTDDASEVQRLCKPLDSELSSGNDCDLGSIIAEGPKRKLKPMSPMRGNSSRLLAANISKEVVHEPDHHYSVAVVTESCESGKKVILDNLPAELATKSRGRSLTRYGAWDHSYSRNSSHSVGSTGGKLEEVDASGKEKNSDNEKSQLSQSCGTLDSHCPDCNRSFFFRCEGKHAVRPVGNSAGQCYECDRVLSLYCAHCRYYCDPD